MNNHYIEIIEQRLNEASLILRHISKLLREGGFIDSNIRNDFIQSIQAIYNASLFMRWQSMEDTAIKLLEQGENLKATSYEEMLATIEVSQTLLRQMRLLIEHYDNENANRKGKLAAL